MTVEEGANLIKVFTVFKRAVTTVIAEVVEYSAPKFQRKGSAWWADEIKEATEVKRRAYKKMLQRNVAEEIRVRRRTEYKFWKRNVNELMKESKRKLDEEFDHGPRKIIG